MTAFQKGNKLGKKFVAGAQQARIAKKAALASVEAKRAQKSINQLVSAVINGQCPPAVSEQLSHYFPDKVLNIFDALLKKSVLRAMDKGARLKDIIACVFMLAKLSGQNPEEKQDTEPDNGILKDLIDAHFEMMKKNNRRKKQ